MPELELFRALMTAIKRLEDAGLKADDLREVANRVADPYGPVVASRSVAPNDLQVTPNIWRSDA